MAIAAVEGNHPAEVTRTSQNHELALLLKPEEAAKLLRLGRTTVYALVKQKRLKAVKIGSLRRFRLADLKAYVDQLAQEGESVNAAQEA
ncbi:helix-turn-helix domain-containing protein [Allorhizocola rhizosphaerae]|uniref:helix-turn-helix domain-containing protein n=1 Tax=Allorhizocola rhizosphaerae TaxID=1872709 RepID=UPI000E3E18AE|nr:helix-turn-helix domain-containing protein [Allorhizocola rhizosphaerae]